MTGLYNKGKFLECKRSFFQKQESIVVFNMDVNNLKQTNDTYGHEAGDRLIKKAADSILKVSARNVLGFRMGGDEFAMVGIHLSREKADLLFKAWEEGLAELNRRDDGICCVMACGMVYGEKGYNLDALLEEVDRLMYEDKKRKKALSGQ